MLLITLTTQFLGTASADEVKWTDITVKYDDEVLREDLSGVEIIEESDDSIRLDIDTAYNDKTPPDVQLWAVIEGNSGIVDDVVVTDETESLSISPAETLVMYASASEDKPGGIRNIYITGETSLTCIDPTGALGMRSIGTWVASNPDPDPTDGNVYTYRLLGMSIDQSNLRCKEGWSVDSWTAVFQATAENLAYGTTTTAPVYIKRQ